MSLSHEKIALARNMTDVSNEYQNSLNHTKLIYDYYGKGDQTTSLSYNILMTPSALNDYHPVTLTDAKGRVILDRKYANAARAAGIPQEGINGLPSDVMRNRFLDELCNQGIISLAQNEAYKEVPYYQLAGVGGTGVMTEVVDTVDYNGLLDYVSSNCTGMFDTAEIAIMAEGDFVYTNLTKGGASEIVTLSKLLSANTNDQITIVNWSTDNENNHTTEKMWSETNYRQESVDELQTNFNNSTFLDWLEGEFATVLDTGDSFSQNALSYAKMKLQEILSAENTTYSRYGDAGGDARESISLRAAQDGMTRVGFTAMVPYMSGWDFLNSNDISIVAGTVNLNNLAQTFLTYFAQFANGLGSEGNYSDITKDLVSPQYLSKENAKQPYTVLVGRQYSDETAKIAAFYDMIFNQLCTKGWTENPEIVDNQYLQDMLQGGAAFVSRLKDDGMYYQGNYSTDIYIKEIADDAAIAKAEAKYNSEKSKLNQKEQILDLKMKNLDTEISALNTEYDTIKSTISKNIEKSFKRYSA
jgi:hypothetical protein